MSSHAHGYGEKVARELDGQKEAVRNLHLFKDAPNLRKHFASIQENFELFHEEHPWIYKMLVKRARLVKSKGFTEYSIKTLWELLRWHVDTGTGKIGEFKLCNNYTSRYARLIMEKEPDLAGFFVVRNLRSE